MTVRVELLHVANCPHVDTARRLLSSCIKELGVPVGVEEREGAFPSPTILVNGEDVMGAPPSQRVCCRLDVPTREHALAALRGATRE